jgi:hypothetical protein
MSNRKIQLKPEHQAQLLDYIESAANADLFNKTPVLSEIFKGFLESPTFADLDPVQKGVTYERFEELRQFIDTVGDMFIMNATAEFYPLPDYRDDLVTSN